MALTDTCLTSKTEVELPLAWLGQSRYLKVKESLPTVLGTLIAASTVTSQIKKTGGVMNWEQAKGNWKQFKGKVKEQWGKLTDDELDEIEGKRDQLLGKIQKQYGISKEEAERQVHNWERQL
jgi:uncharacterized protein YjbJ (UPF0337 family)